MSLPQAKNSAVRLAFAAAALLTAGRLIQLATHHSPLSPGCPASSARSATAGLPGSASAAADQLTTRRDVAAADAELAELYASCPLSAVIDLQTVATSPEPLAALLPPYRPTADRVPSAPLEPAIPRIRYPVRIRPGAASAPPHTEAVRIAQAPRIATNTPDNKSDWLIDPKEWYTPEENPSSNVGGVSDAEIAPPPETPSASERPPTNNAQTPSASERPPTNNAQTPSASERPPTNNAQTPSASERLPTNTTEPLFSPPAAAGTTSDVVGSGSSPGANASGSPPGANASGSHSEPQPPAPSLQSPAIDPHLELFTKNAYPSARDCAQCHEEIYQQWSVSAHAYAAVSPMFHKFEQKLNDLSQGTVGYFCMRCHAPVATALCASRDEPLWNLPEAAREGITCVACHRVQYVYGKSNGERRIEPGDIFAPVFGGIGGEGVAETIAHKDQFKVKTAPNEPGPGQNIHVAGIYFQPLTRSEFCTPCHQVAVQPGIKLEVVWEQYRASPACKKGIQCQDCHMGRVPGLPLGYDCGPVAKVADKTVNDNRKKSNHIFYGPNYPIAHPGVFPFHLKANRWTMDQWLTFDWRAGWGNKEFEDRVADGQLHVDFPPVWAEADDRFDAREIIDDNIKKLELKRDIRVQVMQNGSHVEGPFFDSPLCRGQDLHLHYIVSNTNEGHNLLTASLGAQPQLWANVVLIGPDGTRLWETGYTDSSGDVANIHSYDVRHKILPFDWQLFNLQSMFLIEGVKGTDREFYVPVNVDVDQLPFIRPGTQPISVINHPPTIRMESQSLAPLGSRCVPYRIPGRLVEQPGTYRLSFRMRSRSEPIYFMRFCGATAEMERAMNEWMIDVHPITVEFTVR